MPIRSIKKVHVPELTQVMKFTQENIDALRQGHGVYMIFSRNSTSFLRRRYCKIGRGAAKAPNIYQRLIGNLAYHDYGRKDDCRDGKNHYFQVMYCKSPADAARLEALFDIWHGRDSEGHNPIEPKGLPLAITEPDFYTLVGGRER